MRAIVLQDLRYAVRGLLRRPLFALVAVLSLALGIGLNTAIYSLFHQAVLRPLPVAAPGQLVNLSAPGLKQGSTSNNSAGRRDAIFSYPMYRDLAASAEAREVLQGIAAHRLFPTNIAFGQGTIGGNGLLVSGSYFGLLGLVPTLGRLIQPGDDVHGSPARVAVLSHRYWQDRLGGDPGVLGRSVRVNGQLLEVVGVAPPGFDGTTFGTRAEVFVPIGLRWALLPQLRDDREDRTSYWVYLFARLAPGIDAARAAEALNRPYASLLREVELPLNQGLDEARQAQFLARRIEVAPGARGQSSTSESAGRPLGLLLAASGLVLLVACLNIANLLLAHGSARAGEFAVRSAIGAGQGRLVRQLLIESGLLAAFGALCALPTASLAIRALVAFLPGGEGLGLQTGLDPEALVFALAVAALTPLLFGLLPALQVARVPAITVLRGETAGATGTRSAQRFRSALATGQVAISMAALGLAGLFAQSLYNLSRVELGMQVEQVAGFSISPGRSGYDPQSSAQLIDRIEEALAAQPGVSAVGVSMVPLFTGSNWGSNVSVEGHEASPEDPTPYFNLVGEGFFATVGMPLLAGRGFTRADAEGAAKVAVVNRRFAEDHGLMPDPVGKRMAIGGTDQLDIEIVGLVGDAKYGDVKEADPAVFYQPRRQNPQVGELNVYVRTQVDPSALLARIPALVAEIDPDLPVESLRTLDQTIARSLAVDRFVGSLATAFAMLATALAALGLYGVLSYTLAQRRREIGLRLALGAAPAQLSRMVLGQVARMSLAGALLGLIAALALGRAAQSLLFGLEPHDPLALAAAVLVLATVSLLAGWLPARRAARTDPLVALRHD